jgi:hypothetical protein
MKADRTDRRTLRDFAVWIVWVAGFLGFLSAFDGYSMATSLTLTTLSAMFIGYRGLPLRRRGDAAASSSLRRLVRLAAWVTLGPLVAAYFKLIAFQSLTITHRSLEIVPPLLILACSLLAADRYLAGRR